MQPENLKMVWRTLRRGFLPPEHILQLIFQVPCKHRNKVMVGKQIKLSFLGLKYMLSSELISKNIWWCIFIRRKFSLPGGAKVGLMEDFSVFGHSCYPRAHSAGVLDDQEIFLCAVLTILFENYPGACFHVVCCDRL